MNTLEERNIIWEMAELVIEKHKLENSTEFLDPIAEDILVFGNFVKGHPMSFDADFKNAVAEISEKLPSDYEIVKSYALDDASGCIGICKING